jgi:hypothetical protein
LTTLILLEGPGFVVSIRGFLDNESGRLQIVRMGETDRRLLQASLEIFFRALLGMEAGAIVIG